MDPDGKIFDLYAEHGTGITRNILIDESGDIVFLTRLYKRSEFERMIEKIKELLSAE